MADPKIQSVVYFCILRMIISDFAKTDSVQNRELLTKPRNELTYVPPTYDPDSPNDPVYLSCLSLQTFKKQNKKNNMETTVNTRSRNSKNVRLGYLPPRPPSTLSTDTVLLSSTTARPSLPSPFISPQPDSKLGQETNGNAHHNRVMKVATGKGLTKRQRDAPRVQMNSPPAPSRSSKPPSAATPKSSSRSATTGSCWLA